MRTDRIIVVDAGIMFPDEELLGVDIIVPDITYLLENKSEVKAIFLTHGHEDHIGALPFILPYLNVPVYGIDVHDGAREEQTRAAWTARGSAAPHVKAKDKIDAGTASTSSSFTSPIPSSTRSRSRSRLRPGRSSTPAISRSIRRRSTERLFDLHTLAAYGDQGVLALFSDSTNAEHAGYTQSERSVNDRFESIFRTSKGRIVLSCFTSSIPRLQLVIDQAKQYGRVVSFLGRRMSENTELAEELGFLEDPARTGHSLEGHSQSSARKVCVVSGGCQGEPMSALSRLALDDHKDFKIEEGDTVDPVGAPDSGQ